MVGVAGVIDLLHQCLPSAGGTERWLVVGVAGVVGGVDVLHVLLCPGGTGCWVVVGVAGGVDILHVLLCPGGTGWW